VGAATPVPRICGRTAEVAILDDALDRIESGRSVVVLIEGEAGIGKTRLLDKAMRDARARGMLVASGRAGEMEQSRPFGLVAGAFECARSSPDPRRAAIGELLATEGAAQRELITVTSDPGLRFRAVDAFADLAEDLALSGPLVIGLDDLQWADPSSLLTLAALSRRLAYHPVAVIGCLRPSPRAPELDRLVDTLETAEGWRLALRGLNDNAVTELVADAIAAAPGPGLLAGLSGAAGNPLFVIELLGALAQEGAITTADGRADVTAISLPPSLRLTLLRRVSFLPESTLEMLRAASMLGTTFTLTDLATVVASSALELSAVLSEAVRTHVIEDDGTQLHFRHELIREAIYEDLPGSVRRALHREAGDRLARAGASALHVAEHFARGADRGDAEAIEWLARAAREAAPRSPEVAAGFLEQATSLMTPDNPDRDLLLAERAGCLMWAGRVGDAKEVCHALLDRQHDARAEGPARICLGHALLVSGQPQDGLRELERVGESPVLTDGDRASALGWASIAHRWLGDLDASAATAERARSAAAVADDHLTTAIAMASLAVVAELRGHLREAIGIIDGAVRFADQSPDKAAHRYPLHAARAFILVELDRFEEATGALDTDRRISEELGLGWHMPSYQIVRAAERFVAGEWDDAIVEVEANVELADETGQAFGLILGRSVLALISLHRNELSRAEEAVAAAMNQIARAGVLYRTQWAMWARALIQEAHGQIDNALATLADCWDSCEQQGIMLEQRMIGADLVRLAITHGDRERARDVAAAVTAITDESGESASLVGAALRCRGLAEDDAEILQDAVNAYAQGLRPLDLALTAEEAGAAFAGRGEPDRAEPLLRQALEIYERLDAVRDLARVEAVMRVAGIRRGRRGRRGRPQIGWHSLTPTEHTIAMMVAEGLSNPQIGDRLYISRRTVQTHLLHVFAKLDITSRAQLAVLAIQHPGDQRHTR
jgi:DNA-binding CsgD family transcriptional regulator